MQKNIKEIINTDYKNTNSDLPNKHRLKFESRLQKELHSKKGNKFLFMKIAASFLILISLGVFTYSDLNKKEVIQQNYTLGSLSPELEKIESYYTNAITYELTQLEINSENQLIFDKYFGKLEELTKQYKLESNQLNLDKINEKTINALIDNLQMRLQLLLQLKEQLKTIKSKTHEKNNI
jgi:hypothetical protein